MPAANFAAMIELHPGPVQALANALREVVLQTLPQAQEQMVGGAKVGLALYQENGSVLCGIQPSDNACLLYVHQIKSHLLFKLGGRGKHARHIRFNSVQEVNPADVAKLLLEIRQAAGLPG